MSTCASCGHSCPPDSLCSKCGGDPMTAADILCVGCDGAPHPELSFDGCGINGPDKYRSRVATFASADDAGRYGPLFEAAPRLLAMLRRAADILPASDTCPLCGEENGDIAPFAGPQIRAFLAEFEGWEPLV